jgi:ribokinase
LKSILVVGSTNIDLVFGVYEMPRPGETVMSRSFREVPGGKGANQACACGKLGGNCTFLSAVGKDSMGEKAMDSLRSANVDTRKMLCCETLPTGMAAITVDSRGENSIVIVAGANSACDEAYIRQNEANIQTADIILTQQETPRECVSFLLERAKALGKCTILNPAPASGSLPDEMLRGLRYITPNETELGRLTNMRTQTMEEIALAARALYEKGVENVLVTVGARGALLYNRDGLETYPAFPVERVIDSTAAGDTFNAGLAVALAEGLSTACAIRFANAAAAISIGRSGAQTSIPSRAEVEQFLKSAQPG